jgi:spore coat protein A
MMRKLVALLVCSFSCVWLAGRAGADSVSLRPTQDNTLYEPISRDGFQDRSNGAGTTMFTGKTKDALDSGGEVAVRRAVLAFDIAGNIPAGATIDSVTLRLRCTKAKLNTGFNVRLHRLLSDWGEGASNTGNSQQGRGDLAAPNDATWRHTFYPTQFWAALGGDYATTSSATTSVGGAGSYSWGSTSAMVADVQAWLNAPAQNFGWIVIGDETQIETAKQFGTRENTQDGGINRPELVVNYTPQQISGGCCQGETCTIQTAGDCTALGAVYQGDGTSCSPNPCVVAFGACCASNGTCSAVTQSVCEAGAGVFQGDGSTCATVGCAIQLTPYLDPLPVPGPATPVSGQPGAAATYDLTMREFQQQLHAQLPPTTVWGFDDGTAGPSTPGPLIEARSGQPVTVNWINDLRELGSGALRTSHYLQQSADDLNCTHGAQDEAKTVVHLHGGHVPTAVDGYPEATFLPGSPAVTYQYPNVQQAAPIWFHDHALGITRLNVYMGLAGIYWIRDAVEDAINLPKGEFEIPLVLQDRKFKPDGSLSYPETWQDHFFGDKVMVNGKVWPFVEVKQGKYRFRLVNGSGSRVYRLSLDPPSGSMSFTVIGNEGGLLPSPARGVGALTFGPGERYDVVFDFEPYATGDEILLVNSAPAPFPNGSVDVTQVMKFVVTAAAGDVDPIPNTLRPIERLQETSVVETRDLVLKKSGLDACGRAFWEINELEWHDITEYPELGTTEIWRFINDSGVSHPMHMHLVFFQILDRDGFTRGPGGQIIPDGTPQAPLLEESGWKDTAMVGPNEILRVIARFDDYTGKYPYHCHILEHEDHEMMRQFQTIQCGNGVLEPTEACDDGNTVAGDCCSPTCEVAAPDGDGDGICDLADNCPFWASANVADADGDGRGDECECTDQNGDGRNTVSDLVAINLAIFNPGQVTPLCDGNNDGMCNVNDIIAANIAIFSPTNTSTCSRQPVVGP